MEVLASTYIVRPFHRIPCLQSNTKIPPRHHHNQTANTTATTIDPVKAPTAPSSSSNRRSPIIPVVPPASTSIDIPLLTTPPHRPSLSLRTRSSPRPWSTTYAAIAYPTTPSPPPGVPTPLHFHARPGLHLEPPRSRILSCHNPMPQSIRLVEYVAYVACKTTYTGGHRHHRRSPPDKRETHA